MNVFLAKILLLDDGALMLLQVALIVAGFALGALLLRVRFTLRRVTYLGIMMLGSLGLSLTQFGWLRLSAAAEAGLFAVAVLCLMACFVLFGIVTWLAAAGRSNHMRGDTRRAWLALVPAANLVLVFGAPGAESARLRSRTTRWVFDPALVLTAVGGFAMVKGLETHLDFLSFNQPLPGAALNAILAQSQSVADSFAREASASRPLLPTRVDEVTMLTNAVASGERLTLTYTFDSDGALGLNARQALAEWDCRLEVYGHDLFRGGRVLHRFLGADNVLVDEIEISAADCTT